MDKMLACLGMMEPFEPFTPPNGDADDALPQPFTPPKGDADDALPQPPTPPKGDADDELPPLRPERAVASARRIGKPARVEDGAVASVEDDADEPSGPPDLDDRASLAFDGDDRAVLPRKLRGRRLRGLLDAAEAKALEARAAESAFADRADSVDDRPAYECVLYDRGRVLEPELWGLAALAARRATPALRDAFGYDALEPSQCLLRRYRPGERREHRGSKRERNSQLQRLLSRPFSTRFG